MIFCPMSGISQPLSPKQPHPPPPQGQTLHLPFYVRQGEPKWIPSNIGLDFEPHSSPSRNHQPSTENCKAAFPFRMFASAADLNSNGTDKLDATFDLFTHLAPCVDDLAVIHGIKTDNQNHGPSTYHVDTGSQFPNSPSIVSWIQHSLGSLNRNISGYVVIQYPRGAPLNGAAVWAPMISSGGSPKAPLLRPQVVPILNLQTAKDISSRRAKSGIRYSQWSQSTLSIRSAHRIPSWKHGVPPTN